MDIECLCCLHCLLWGLWVDVEHQQPSLRSATSHGIDHLTGAAAVAFWALLVSPEGHGLPQKQPCCQQRSSGCCGVSGQLISQLLSLLWGWETPALPPRSEVPVLLGRVRSSHPALQAACGYKHVPAAPRRKPASLKFLMRSKTHPSQPGWLLPPHLCWLLFQTHLGAGVSPHPLGGSLPSTPH